MLTLYKLILAALVLSSTATHAVFGQTSPATAPEAATLRQTKPLWRFNTFAVATAHPLASEAGAAIIRQGGSAIDAAIAAQMVLGLVEPQSSGLGGGGFLVYSKGSSVMAYDGRETAPAATAPDLFMQTTENGQKQPMAFTQAMVGGRAVGVPGLLAMLHLAHQDHGRLAWPELFLPAIRLAEQGFPVGQRLHSLLARDKYLRLDAEAGRYFYNPQGDPWPVAHLLKNPALADLLRGIARDGPTFFYQGSVAEAISQSVQSHQTNPGMLTAKDMGSYQALRRQPICFDWQPENTKRLQVCGSPPPSSGTIAIGQILGILAQRPDLETPEQRDHAYLEAARLAFADRDHYIADPDFIEPPAGTWQSLLRPEYLQERAALVTEKSLNRAHHGIPRDHKNTPISLGTMQAQPESGTTHISVIDAQGNALALTSSIEAAFGARLMVHGILLINQLTDFSFRTEDTQGRPIANRPAPGKRPRSSMSPTLVFDGAIQQPIASLGSAGGALIIHYVSHALRGVFANRLSVQVSLDQPMFGSLNGPSLIEQDRFPPARAAALRLRGAEVRSIPMTSGTQMLLREGNVIIGGADARREGWVSGDYTARHD
ncbi:MAG: gamma-glutamyltransferase family protein [Burkholderiaceae bacterium]